MYIIIICNKCWVSMQSPPNNGGVESFGNSVIEFFKSSFYTHNKSKHHKPTNSINTISIQRLTYLKYSLNCGFFHLKWINKTYCPLSGILIALVISESIPAWTDGWMSAPNTITASAWNLDESRPNLWQTVINNVPQVQSVCAASSGSQLSAHLLPQNCKQTNQKNLNVHFFHTFTPADVS